MVLFQGIYTCPHYTSEEYDLMLQDTYFNEGIPSTSIREMNFRDAIRQHMQHRQVVRCRTPKESIRPISPSFNIWWYEVESLFINKYQVWSLTLLPLVIKRIMHELENSFEDMKIIYKAGLPNRWSVKPNVEDWDAFWQKWRPCVGNNTVEKSIMKLF